MSDLSRRILNQITSRLNDILKTKNNMESMVYRDEPIIRRASELERPAAKRPLQPVQNSYALPKIYQDLRRLASDASSVYLSREELFYRQALLMQDVTDHYQYRGTCMHYMPTYQSLTDAQLRGYFTWRALRRAGSRQAGCPDYYKLYIYELIHQIGTPDPGTGFTMLEEACQELVRREPLYEMDSARWLRDYILYYHLDRPLPGIEKTLAYDQALSIVLDPENQDAFARLQAACTLSSYRFENSRFYKEHPDLCARVFHAFWEALSLYYQKHRKNSLEESLFGFRTSVSYVLFQNAVFFDYMTHPDITFTVSPLTTYQCRGRWWTLTRYQGEPGKNKELGRLLHAMDRVLRDQYQFPSPLRDDGKTPKYIETMLVRIIQEDRKAKDKPKEETAAPVLHFNLNGLDRIRAASDRTRDSLLVEEEQEMPEVPVPQPTPAPVEAGESQASLLDPQEQQFLSLLLEGRPYDGFLKEHGLLLSVIVDSINDKLYDEFSDTVLLFDGQAPELIEDYIEELKGLIP